MNILARASAAIVILCASLHAGAQPKNNTGWPVYGGQPAGDHYSALTQINRGNVARLRVAWTYDSREQGGMQTSPIIVGGVLYGYTPSQKVIALDAASGKLLWKFDSGIVGTQPDRGLAYWTDGHDSRILAGVMNFLYALDPATGKPIEAFGEGGRVDLRKDLGRDYTRQAVAMTSPGIVYKDLIIVGFRAPETPPAPPGDIRAYDVRTGKLRWSFHTIPHPGEFGYDTWPPGAWDHMGAANNWAGMSVDTARGIVYVPTGSAVFDFYGGDRIGDNLFADTLLALDAATGKRIWSFQGVHHDIWDRDFPSPPALLTVTRNGRRVDAIAQTTKQGWVYLFDRANGKPLFPIKEKKYPASTVPGEATAPTQPLPVRPAPFARQLLTEDMLTQRTPQAHAWAVRQFRTFRSAGQFVPFSVGKQTVIFPGFDGGAEWGGPAVDPATGVIYVNANDIAWTGRLVENTHAGTGAVSGADIVSGIDIYEDQCAICHGDDRAGDPPAFPSLIDVDKRLTAAQMADTIHNGKGRMTGFPSLQDAELDALLAYLRTGKETEPAPAPAAGKKEMPQARTAISESNFNRPDSPLMKYRFTGYRKFYDPDGYPAVAPPWGTLNAIDLNTGEYLWKIPLGNYPELAGPGMTNAGMTNTGTENYGGPIVTAGGLVFIGATIFDRKFRAFDSRTGKLLWETTLPFAGLATPATYMVNGRQYVVIAAGGGRDRKSPSGGMYVAFALP
jgi:quinoprotein glucose dehydrogenase